MKNKKPELLCPAGDWPSLVAAVNAGADSIYFGLKVLNMRAKAKNFELKELSKIINFCHKNDVKAYLTMNTIIYEKELSLVKKILAAAKKAKVDAVIAWDFSVVQEARRLKIPIHLSTQSSISNSESLNFFKKFGIESFNLARECSLDDIKRIKKKSTAKIEVFVHGAMCISLSGRCFLSQELFKKSANRGECLQPCRREYLIKGVEEDTKLLVGSHYVLSPKDLCALPFIKQLMKAGVDTFKIEGRNRSPEYVKVVTESYREAIDSSLTKEKIEFLMNKLRSVYNRDFSSGFYLGTPSTEGFTDAYGSKATANKVYVGKVINYYSKSGVAEIKIDSSSFKVGDHVLFIGNSSGVLEQKVSSIWFKDKSVNSAIKGQVITLKTDSLVRINDKFFVVKKTGSDSLIKTKVLCFGTFDLLHPGHLDFFRQAKQFGNHLTVVVARDNSVEGFKGKRSVNDEESRLDKVKSSYLVDEAMLGNEGDKYLIIEVVDPDVICLGYDQQFLTDDLNKELKNRNLKAKVVKLKPFMPEKYKSSILMNKR